jgi:UDP-N-acetylmuramyl tripeptide synthase
LNLSRDQLDRHSETRMLAQRWRDALARFPDAPVVANVDDPLVVFAAQRTSQVLWVEGGAYWHTDATTCPTCGKLIARDGSDWSCSCGLHRPEPAIRRDDAPRLALPGRANRGNVAMAMGAARALGIARDDALEAMKTVASVSGRYRRHRVDGHEILVLLAKNPAGWVETLDVIDEVLGDGNGTVVVAINARGPDGRDPSWLWDVPFEQLAGRDVIATGERATDLAVRLDNAGVHYRKDTRDPLVAAQDASAQQVVIAATYTNFLSISRALADRA